VVLDNEGKEVASFASTHLGMGYFNILPVEGKTYTARLTYGNGSHTVYNLPKVKPTGIVLAVNNDSIPKASVRITASEAFYRENKNKEYTLLIYSGDIATTILCRLDKPIINLDILKRRLHTGIARVTLFSPSGEPLCERLIFIQNYDQLNFTVNSNKPVYAKREKVSININAKTRADSAAMGHFSVSVIDESKVPVDENNENTILTSLLLTSGLTGYIEQPNYYFNHITDSSRANLDLVMLTHGYRRFEWKKLLNNEYPPAAFQPERGLEIAGIAKSLAGKPLVKGTVSLISPQGGMPLNEVTDDKGRFKFSNLVFPDSARFILQAVNANGKNTTRLSYDKDDEPAVIPARFNQNNDVNQLMAAYIENSRNQLTDYAKFGNLKGKMLKEVKIRAVKKEDNQYRTQSLAGAGNADQVWHRSDIHGGGLLSDQLNGLLRGVVFKVPSRARQPGKLAYSQVTGIPMLIVVDGAILGTDYPIDVLNLSNVETVEVLKGASASIYGMQGGGGVLVITTRQGTGLEAKDVTAVGILPIKGRGFYKARAFYAPKYEHPNNTFNRKDLRTTIYWNPELVTDKNGNASFDYYNADGTGSYRLVIEGIDERGNLGRRVFRYKVD
jgi:TonB-dependent SusC/RagA subfamily outer membrane receptor